jgi:hypothetical protein
LRDLLHRIAKDSGDPTSVTIGVDESRPRDVIVTLPSDGEASIGLLQMDGFWIAVPSQPGRQLIGDIEEPGISGIGRNRTS